MNSLFTVKFSDMKKGDKKDSWRLGVGIRFGVHGGGNPSFFMRSSIPSLNSCSDFLTLSASICRCLASTEGLITPNQLTAPTGMTRANRTTIDMMMPIRCRARNDLTVAVDMEIPPNRELTMILGAQYPFLYYLQFITSNPRVKSSPFF